MAVRPIVLPTTREEAALPLREGTPHNSPPGDDWLCAGAASLMSLPTGLRDVRARAHAAQLRSVTRPFLNTALRDVVGSVGPLEYS